MTDEWIDEALKPIADLRCPHCGHKSFDVLIEAAKATILAKHAEAVEAAQAKFNLMKKRLDQLTNNTEKE